jgi:hypothetical protein
MASVALRAQRAILWRRTRWSLSKPQHRTLIGQAVDEPSEEVKLARIKIKSAGKPNQKGVYAEEEEKEKELFAAQHAVDHVAQEKAKTVTKVGAAANLALAISKGSIGISVASTGLVADAANSLGDLLSDAVVYYTVTEARKVCITIIYTIIQTNYTNDAYIFYDNDSGPRRIGPGAWARLSR